MKHWLGIAVGDPWFIQTRQNNRAFDACVELFTPQTCVDLALWSDTAAKQRSRDVSVSGGGFAVGLRGTVQGTMPASTTHLSQARPNKTLRITQTAPPPPCSCVLWLRWATHTHAPPSCRQRRPCRTSPQCGQPCAAPSARASTPSWPSLQGLPPRSAPLLASRAWWLPLSRCTALPS